MRVACGGLVAAGAFPSARAARSSSSTRGHGLTFRCAGTAFACHASALVRPEQDTTFNRPGQETLLRREDETPLSFGRREGYWRWRGHRIRYHRAETGTEGSGVGPLLICIHGFGASADHWRKNLSPLGAAGYRVFAVDLLGYGFSDKPDPRAATPNSIYNFDNWASQVLDFADAAGGGPDAPVVFIANSIGCSVALAAAARPDARARIRGLVLLNFSLRGLHVSKQAAVTRPLVAAFQRLLRESSAGPSFFEGLATAPAVEFVLQAAYSIKAAVTPELVSLILAPGKLPGAAAVFLDFISYSGGPLPEEDLAKCVAPVWVAWGVDDPWEPIALGRAACECAPVVKRFVPLAGVGHCPQDEAPDVVNKLILGFLAQHAA